MDISTRVISTEAAMVAASGMLTQGWGIIDDPAIVKLQEVSKEAMELFCHLCENHPALLAPLVVRHYKEDVDDVGLFEKRGQAKEDGGKFDVDKRYFHYCPSLMAELEAKRVDYAPDIGRLLELNAKSHELSHLTVLNVLQELDKQLPLEGKSFARALGDPAVYNISRLRTLHYGRPVRDGESIAQKHPDRCGFTLHEMERHRGLYIHKKSIDPYNQTPEDELVPYVVEPGKMLIFPGAHAELFVNGEYYKPNAVLKALPHSVRGIVDPGSEGMLRGSLVYFAKLFSSFHGNVPKLAQSQVQAA